MKVKKYEAVIACGGLGTRLKDITRGIPKPLLPINGKSTLERCLEQLSKNSINNILITIGYKSVLFQKFKNNLEKRYNSNIDLFEEKKPLGECGALWLLKDKLSTDFVFVNGDIVLSIDFNRLINFHKRLSSDLTLVSHTSDHPEDSDLLSTPNGTFIEDIFFKNSKNQYPTNAYLGNSGICVIKKSLLDLIKAPNQNDSKSIFHFLVRNAYSIKKNIYSYNTSEYIKDMGTPKRLKLVCQDLKQNKVYPRNYLNKQKALFIDRDNTLIKCTIGDYILEKDDLIFMDENISKISFISKNYNLVCLVTNQPIIAMGRLSLKELEAINSIVVNYCLSKGLKIDVITFCPHHPHKGFKNEVTYLKRDCFCRKPNPGLFLEQAYLRNINLEDSLMIGDSDVDYLAARNAGCQFKYINDL
tara:strand:+ start:992 stop:2236 length:1245 start_codon:yes stop_codon:yes gene_type:complete